MLDNKKLLFVHGHNLTLVSNGFRKIYRTVFESECPVDRFGLLDKIGIDDTLPLVNMVPKPVYKLTGLITDWQDRYQSIYSQVAEKVYATSGTRDIVVMYSGGIDSAGVLVALMQRPEYREFLDAGRFRVAMTTASINEYPELFYRDILPNIPIEPTDYNTLMMDPGVLLVTGDDGDHVIGNTGTPNFLDLGANYLQLPKHTVYPYLDHVDPTGLLSTVVKQLDPHCPFEIVSVCQLYWWVGQCFELQTTMCRPYYWSHISNLSEITTNQKVFRFFMHDLWNTFSFEYMSTNPVYTNGVSIRDFPKQYIVGITGDANYLTKDKIKSQALIYRIRTKTRIYEDLTYAADNLKIIV